MKIEINRLEFVELKQEDYKEIAAIACNMAWNDTINILLDDDQQEGLKHFNPELAQYRKIIINYTNKISLSQYNKEYKDLSGNEKCELQLYKKIPQKIIPEKTGTSTFLK